MALLGTAYVPNTPTLIGNLGVRHENTIKALSRIGAGIGHPEAAIVVTPHFVTGGSIGVVSSPRLRQIYDFYGFPDEFYKVRYEPPGSPTIAGEILQTASCRGLPVSMAENWGLDHGAWSPLIHIFPNADIPVIPVSISPELGTGVHEAFGRVLREVSRNHNICVIATGSLIHRLDLFHSRNSSVPKYAQDYLDTALKAFSKGNWEDLWSVSGELMSAASPEGGELPLRVVSGVVGENYTAIIHSSEIEFSAASLTTVTFVSSSDIGD